MTFVFTESFVSVLVEGTETCGPPVFEMLPSRDTVFGTFKKLF
jgi:hypothetical protein